MNKEYSHDDKPIVALINYYLTDEELLIFLVKKGFKEPKVYRQSSYEDNQISKLLELCAQRLMIDFNGLDPDLRNNQYNLSNGKDLVQECLRLEPRIEEHKRFQAPNYPGNILLKDHKIKFYKFLQTYLDKISEWVFPTELKKEIEDCNLLCISPYGALHSIPLHALKWSEDHDGEHQYIIQKFGVSYVPNITTLQYCQNKNPARRIQNYKPKNCLVISSGKTNDYEMFEEDISLIKRSGGWDSKNFFVLKSNSNDKNSTKTNIINNVSNKDVIHFSTHGIFDLGQSRELLECGLLISDDEGSVIEINNMKRDLGTLKSKYLLKAEEIFNLKLNSTLITLRACSSGRSVIERGDELLGLTRALLFAGTSSLIASLWNVNIESSKLLLSKFYELWLNPEKPLPKWKAFQQAHNSFILRNGEKYCHMYHWAPFILIGDWV
jgi:CHAT domain-containing protein